MNNITHDSSQLYRITYEAYSKFANDVNRCSSLAEVGEVCKNHLKYLLNFRILRMSIIQEDNFVFIEQRGTENSYTLGKENILYDYEKKILEDHIPYYSEEIPLNLLEGQLTLNELNAPKLWGWYFRKYEREVVVSLLSDEDKKFSTGDIEILKLVVDCIHAKFNEVLLKRQLAEQNESLMEAYETIKKKNSEIHRIVENQKAIIAERTKEITDKNKKLLDISSFNAHNIREPLSRIQGIIQLVDLVDNETLRKELLPKLLTSSNEMDSVLQEAIEMASTELIKLKASEL